MGNKILMYQLVYKTQNTLNLFFCVKFKKNLKYINFLFETSCS